MPHVPKTVRPRRGLVAARNALRLSQNDVAEQVGTTPLSISRWERGVTNPSTYFRTHLCQLFGKSARELDLDEEAEPQMPQRGFTHPEEPVSSLIDPLIPLPPSWRLFGRDRLLASLKAQMRAGESFAMCALNGLPGVGKTAMAVALAHDPEVREMFPDGILWGGLGPEPDLLRVLSHWAALLDIPESRMARVRSLEQWAVELRVALGQRTVLIIIDDAWRVEDALACKVGGVRCSYVLTTRSWMVASSFADTTVNHINELNEQQSLTLLATLAGDMIYQERDAAQALVREVGGLPLALTLIGRYLRLTTASGQPRRLQAAITRLHEAEERLKLGELQAPLERHTSLGGRQSISLKAVIAASIDRLPAGTQATLNALSVFLAKPYSFSEEAALAIAACTIEELDMLHDIGLLESSQTDRYSLHQTIHDYARTVRQDAPDSAIQQRMVAYYVCLVEQHSAEYEIVEQDSSNILQALETAFANRWWGELVRGACAFVPFLLARGLYTDAESLLHQAYEGATCEGNQKDRVRSLLSLGQIAHKQGNFARAETEYFRTGLDLARQIRDIQSELALISELAWVLDKQGKFVEAKHYLLEGLELARRSGSREQLGAMLKVMGSVEADLGNLSSAERYLREGVALARDLRDRELLCVMLINLGFTLAEQGSAEANRSFLAALELAGGLHHKEYMALVLLNLCDLALGRQEIPLAEFYAHMGLLISKPIDHREWTCVLLANLIIIKRHQRQFDQAEIYLQEALMLAYQIDRPALTCEILYYVGELRLEQHRLDEANTIYHSMLEQLPDNAPILLARGQYGLARVAAEQGNLEDARRLAHRSQETFESMGHHMSREVQIWISGLPS